MCQIVAKTSRYNFKPNKIKHEMVQLNSYFNVVSIEEKAIVFLQEKLYAKQMKFLF